MMQILLEVDRVTIRYDEKEVVKDVSFTLKEGEVLGIVGESGSGKSTLLKAVMGLEQDAGQHREGQIWYKGQELTAMKEKELQKLRGPEISMIFQNSEGSLCPVRKIGKQIQEAMKSHEKISVKEVKQTATAIMEKVGLEEPDRIWNSYPFELSGGMNQRVGICMAMLMNPSLLLADELTSALDVTVQKQVVEELQALKEEYGMAMILVTHNISVVRQLADQILVLQDGVVREYGTREAVLEHPKNSYTQNLMDSVLHLEK